MALRGRPATTAKLIFEGLYMRRNESKPRQTWGIVISVIGMGLFLWHLIRVQINPDYERYVSHKVMAMNGIVLLVFGIAIYFLGGGRKKRKHQSNT